MASRIPYQKDNVGNQSNKNDKSKNVACRTSKSSESVNYKQRSNNFNVSNKNRQYRNPRNNYSNYNNGNNGWKRKQFSRDELDAPVGEQGNKKVNLNHLLNFSFDPRNLETSKTVSVRNRQNSPSHKTFNKEEYLQANCQFVVSKGGCYDVHQMDPDVLVDWDNVEQIHMWDDKHSLCPICLDPPISAKITRCGHIYCYPCILHYLALDDKSWRKCPICHESVHKKDLKSVVLRPEETHSVGETIKMNLMCRYRGNMVPFMVGKEDTSEVEKQFNDESTEPRFCKILTCTKENILKRIIERELNELNIKKSVENDDFELTFINAAIEECNKRRSALFDAVELAEEKRPPADVTDISRSRKDSEASGSQAPYIYYFYQSSDDQNIFLHPLNIKCLIRHYGSLANCPHEISANIVELQQHMMDEVTRKRHRYLSHLPVSCEFRIAELKLKPPLVSQGVLNEFESAINERASQRKRKMREEKKVLRKMHVEEMKKHGVYPEARISLESNRHFPTMYSSTQTNNTGSSFSVLVTQPAHDNNSDSRTSGSNISSLSSSVGSQDTDGQFSFARMLQTSSAMQQPSLVKPATKSSVGNTSSSTATESTFDHNDPDYVPPPSYQSTFSDALSSALDNLDIAAKNNSSHGSRRKGKRGKKKVLLFSTSGHGPHA